MDCYFLGYIAYIFLPNWLIYKSKCTKPKTMVVGSQLLPCELSPPQPPPHPPSPQPIPVVIATVLVPALNLAPTNTPNPAAPAHRIAGLAPTVDGSTPPPHLTIIGLQENVQRVLSGHLQAIW